MQIIEINSLSHPGVEVFATLTEAQLRNRLEPEKGIFIAESPKVISRALDAGCETEQRFLQDYLSAGPAPYEALKEYMVSLYQNQG